MSQIAPVAVILAALLFGSFHTVTRVHHRAPLRSGVTQSACIGEPAGSSDGGTPECGPARLLAPTFQLGLALIPLIVLKLRRLAMVPMTVRRLKLPPASGDPLPSHAA